MILQGFLWRGRWDHALALLLCFVLLYNMLTCLGLFHATDVAMCCTFLKTVKNSLQNKPKKKKKKKNNVLIHPLSLLTDKHNLSAGVVLTLRIFSITSPNHNKFKYNPRQRHNICNRVQRVDQSRMT